MHKPVTFVVEILMILQWGVVTYLGYLVGQGFSASAYMLSFLVFWLGLAALIFSVCGLVMTQKKPVKVRK